MELILQALVGTQIFNFIWAIYTTIKKEKIMIEQGEGSLPSNTYGFIVVRNLTRILLFTLILPNIPASVVDVVLGTSWYWTIAFFLAIAFVVELFSMVIETIIRFLYLNYQYRKMKKNSEQDRQEEF